MLKVLDEVCTPKRGTKYSAYLDLFAREDVVIGAGDTKVVRLGVKLDFDGFWDKYENSNLFDKSDYRKKHHLHSFLKSHYLEVALRSSLGVKGLIIANGIGIIDLDYPDEIGLIVHNPTRINYIADDDHYIYELTGGEPFFINKGDKVAQCTLKEHKGYLMGYESDVVRDGGFGSTGA